MPNELRILHLEDSPVDAELVRETLTAEGIECEIVCVETREDFLAAVEKGGFGLILADYSLPSFDGLSALALAHERCPAMPFIFVTGTLGEDVAVETLKGGATDYVLKGKLSRLAPAVRRALKEAEEKIGRRRAEQHLYRTTRALKTLGHCNQALVRATDESALLQDICRIIVEVGGYRLAWVGFAEHDDAKTVRPVAQVGCEEGYLEKAHITWADEERGRGPSGTAIREGRICIAKSISEDPLFAPWRDEALKRGHKSSVALPLSLDGTVGVLNIFAPEPDAFAADEVALLTEMAADLAYGIKSIRSSEERKKSEEELRLKVEELERFRSATVQREFRIRELKNRVKELEKKLGEAARSSAGK